VESNPGPKGFGRVCITHNIHCKYIDNVILNLQAMISKSRQANKILSKEDEYTISKFEVRVKKENGVTFSVRREGNLYTFYQKIGHKMANVIFDKHSPKFKLKETELGFEIKFDNGKYGTMLLTKSYINQCVYGNSIIPQEIEEEMQYRYRTLAIDIAEFNFVIRYSTSGELLDEVDHKFLQDYKSWRINDVQQSELVVMFDPVGERVLVRVNKEINEMLELKFEFNLRKSVPLGKGEISHRQFNDLFSNRDNIILDFDDNLSQKIEERSVHRNMVIDGALTSQLDSI